MTDLTAKGAPPAGRVTLADAAATEALGRAVGARLRGGELIHLAGELGAGKTTFTRGLLAGLNGDANDVASPTYTYLHAYRGGRLLLHHADLYRLRGRADDLGLDEFLTDGGVLVVEWPERCPDLGVTPLRIAFTYEGAAGERRCVDLPGCFADLATAQRE